MPGKRQQPEPEQLIDATSQILEEDSSQAGENTELTATKRQRTSSGDFAASSSSSSSSSSSRSSQVQDDDCAMDTLPHAASSMTRDNRWLSRLATDFNVKLVEDGEHAKIYYKEKLDIVIKYIDSDNNWLTSILMQENVQDIELSEEQLNKIKNSLVKLINEKSEEYEACYPFYTFCLILSRYISTTNRDKLYNKLVQPFFNKAFDSAVLAILLGLPLTEALRAGLLISLRGPSDGLPWKMTLWHWAACTENQALIEVLVANHKSYEVATMNALNQAGFAPLHHAAARGHLACVQALINLGIVSSAEDTYGLTALHFAAENAHENVLRFLLDKTRIDVNIKDRDDDTALHLAMSGGHLRCVNVLIGNGADPKLANRFGETPLHQAAMSEYQPIREWAMGYSHVDETEKQDLIWLARFRSDFKCLPRISMGRKAKEQYFVKLESRGNRYIDSHVRVSMDWFINLLQRDDPTPESLSQDQLTSVIDKISECLQSVTTREVKPDHFEFFSLIRHYLINSDREQIQQYFLTHPLAVTNTSSAAMAMLLGLPVTKEMISVALAAENNDEQIPLWKLTLWHWVAITDHEQGFKLLTQYPEAECNRLITDIKKFNRPVYAAAALGHHTILKYLLAYRSDKINAESRDAALLLAIKFGHLRCAKLLVAHGASLNFDKIMQNGWLDVIASGYRNMLQWLINEGLDVNDDGFGDYTALHEAVAHGQLACVKILVEAGSDIFADILTFATPSGIGFEYNPIEGVVLSETDSPGILDYLLDKSGTDRARARIRNYTHLFKMACSTGNLDCARLLLLRGANPYDDVVQDGDGCPWYRPESVIRHILKLGVAVINTPEIPEALVNRVKEDIAALQSSNLDRTKSPLLGMPMFIYRSNTRLRKEDIAALQSSNLDCEQSSRFGMRISFYHDNTWLRETFNERLIYASANQYSYIDSNGTELLTKDYPSYVGIAGENHLERGLEGQRESIAFLVKMGKPAQTVFIKSLEQLANSMSDDNAKKAQVLALHQKLTEICATNENEDRLRVFSSSSSSLSIFASSAAASSSDSSVSSSSSQSRESSRMLPSSGR